MSARRINLLPPEFVARRRLRQRIVMVLAASGALIALLAAVFVFQGIRLSGEKRALAEQQQRNAVVRAQVAELNDFARLESELKQKTALLADLTQNEVRWSVVLADISLVIPQPVWLTSFTGSVNTQFASSPGSRNQPVSLGSIAMSGRTFTHLDVARWLIRLSQVDAFVFPYISLSSKNTVGLTNVVDFNSTVDLAAPAFRKNQPGAERR